MNRALSWQEFGQVRNIPKEARRNKGRKTKTSRENLARQPHSLSDKLAITRT